MKPTLDFKEEMLHNEDRFDDPFFKKLKLRHAPQPLVLSDTVSKNYLFPTLYGDVTSAVGIFMCDYQKAKKIMPHPKVKPIKMTRGRSIVALACYEYKNVMNVRPYNEIAMTIPVMVDPAINVPVLPMVVDSFKEFGYYVFSMPVTSKENQIRGNKIWGLPKVTQEIDIREEGGDCVTIAKEETGEQYFELRVPMEGDPEKFDVRSNLYSRLGDEFLQSETCFKATFNITKYMNLLFKKNVKPGREYLKLGDTPSAQVLKDLDVEEHPFQLRFAKHMNSCFDLPNPKYKSPIKF
ncbi:acetoacetate decarboxylase family protein [bacterium]